MTKTNNLILTDYDSTGGAMIKVLGLEGPKSLRKDLYSHKTINRFFNIILC